MTVLWGFEGQFGAVYVLETDNFGCEGQAVRTVQILNVSSVNDAEVAAAVLMPNPASGQVSLVWNDLQHADLQVEVHDVLGAKVKTAFSNGVIDIQTLAPGRYTVVARTKGAGHVAIDGQVS